MQSVKVPVFSVLETDFDKWKMRFKAFCTKQGYGLALDNTEKASPEMHLELYTYISKYFLYQKMTLPISRKPMKRISRVALSLGRL